MSILDSTTDSAPLASVAARPTSVVPFVSPRRWLALAPIADAFVLAFAVAVERLGGRAVGADNVSVVWLVGFPAITMTLLAAGGLYRDRLRLQLLDDLRTIAGATAIAAMATIALPVLTGSATSGLPAQGVRLWLFATVYLTASRGGIISSVIASRRHDAAVPTLVVGAGSVGRLIAKRLAEHREIGLNPIGFLDKEPLAGDAGGVTLPVLGASWDLGEVIDTHRVEHVIFTFSKAPHEVMLRMVDECTRRGVRVTVVPRLFERIPQDMSIDYLGGIPLLTIHQSSPTSLGIQFKYVLDRLVAFFLLFLLAPLMLAVSLAVRLTLGRPILYRQVRVGRDCRTFEMLKFRTMKPEEQRRHRTARDRYGDRTGRRRGRRPANPARRALALHFHRRVAAVAERPARRHEHRGPSTRAAALRGRVRGAGLQVQRPPSRQVRHHGLGADQRSTRPDVPRRPGRVGQLVHRELVALARLEDPAAHGRRGLPQRQSRRVALSLPA